MDIKEFKAVKKDMESAILSDIKKRVEEFHSITECMPNSIDVYLSTHRTMGSGDAVISVTGVSTKIEM